MSGLENRGVPKNAIVRLDYLPPHWSMSTWSMKCIYMEWVKMRDAINRSPMNNFSNFIINLMFCWYLHLLYKHHQDSPIFFSTLLKRFELNFFGPYLLTYHSPHSN